MVLEITEKNAAVQVLLAGHGEGEVWGLDSHPLAPKFATSSYDGSVRVWDLTNKVKNEMSLQLRSKHVGKHF